jgi:sulfane dehydrogenase subunit SoxC
MNRRMSRRALLKGLGGLGGCLASVSPKALIADAGRLPSAGRDPDANLPPDIPEWMRHPGHPVNEHPYGVPSPYEAHVIRRATNLTPTRFSSWSYTPLQDLHGTITPNGLFFERDHAGVPQTNPREHRLLVHGLVRRPTIFSMADLLRFPSVTHVYFIECSGNSLTEWKKPTGPTAQLAHGLVGNAEWTGVKVSTILNEVGILPEAKWVLAEGADAAAMARSIPLEKMMDDAILAYAQNGEMLRPEQGYPLRLVLPGWEGNTNVKWLRRLKVGKAPWMTREETSKYTDLMPTGIARQFTMVMEAKSVITFPSGGQRLSGPGYYEISGLAWSGRGKIARVEVSFDRGKTWTEAVLQGPIYPKALVRFRLPWRWNGRPATVESRAIDQTGYIQPSREQLVAVRGVNSVYHYNGIQRWYISEDGRVSHE